MGITLRARTHPHAAVPAQGARLGAAFRLPGSIQPARPAGRDRHRSRLPHARWTPPQKKNQKKIKKLARVFCASWCNLTLSSGGRAGIAFYGYSPIAGGLLAGNSTPGRQGYRDEMLKTIGGELDPAAVTGIVCRRRDCHFADTLSSSLWKHLLKVKGNASE